MTCERAGLDIKKYIYFLFGLSTSLAHGASISVPSWNGKAPARACSCMFVHEAANIYADELKLIRAKASKVHISS